MFLLSFSMILNQTLSLFVPCLQIYVAKCIKIGQKAHFGHILLHTFLNKVQKTYLWCEITERVRRNLKDNRSVDKYHIIMVVKNPWWPKSPNMARFTPHDGIYLLVFDNVES